MRECGQCTWCCFFMGVPNFNSPEYSYCPKCKPNKGCTIWKVRPDVCKNTSCVWLKQSQIPDSFRPDRIGVMFELPSASRVYVAHVDPKRPNAWKEGPAQVFIKKIKEAGHSVVVCTKDKSQTFYSLCEGDTLKNVQRQLLNSIQFHQAQGLM